MILLLVILISHWELRGKHFKSLLLIVFLSSFVANPFKESDFFMGLSGVLVWLSFFIRYILLGKRDKDYLPGYLYKIILFISFYGLLVGLFFVDESISVHTVSDVSQLINFTFYLITILLFIRISNSYFKTPSTRYQLMSVFVLSSALHCFAILMTSFGYESLLPSFLVGEQTIMDEADKGLTEISRSAGLIGDYELITDYAIMVMLYCAILLLNDKKKYASIAGLIFAFIIGSFSGTRSFFVVLGITSVAILVLNLFTVKSFKIFKYFLIVVVGFFFLYVVFLKNLVVFQRLQFAGELFFSGASIEETANRNLSSSMEQILSIVPIFGYGSFFFILFNNDSIVSHNLYFAIYVKYGIIGISLFAFFIIRMLYLAKTKLTKSRSKNDKVQLIFLIAFLLGLLLQETKISFVRYFQTIFIYVIFFMVIYFQLKSPLLKEDKIK